MAFETNLRDFQQPQGLQNKFCANLSPQTQKLALSCLMFRASQNNSPNDQRLSKLAPAYGNILHLGTFLEYGSC